jgi:CMP-N,N'-diacetyllegionaminic acid synthase
LEILGLIPARSGSKGLKDKNIMPLCDHPLIEWSIKASLKAESITRTVVSTDSKKYQSIAIAAGAEVPFLRPAELSTDKSSDIDFVLHALEELGKTGYFPDYVVHLRPTTPMRDVQIVDEAIRVLRNDSTLTSLRSVHEMSESAYKNFEISENGRLLTIFDHLPNIEKANKERQSFASTYQANGYVDVLSVRTIKEKRVMHGDNVFGFITPPVVEVDNEFDFQTLQAIASNDRSTFEALFG